MKRSIGLSSRGLLIGALVAALQAVACTSTTFVSTWKAPDAQQLQLKGAKVAAVVMVKSEASRRAAEESLAREISARGAAGIPMYLVLPQGVPQDEEAARKALEAQGVRGVVVMRPVGVDKDLVVNSYGGSMYGGYWGGYYGYGWGHPYATDVETRTSVYVETLIYSLVQNKLVWGGQSKTVNPQSIDQFVYEVASAAADELQTQGLIASQ